MKHRLDYQRRAMRLHSETDFKCAHCGSWVSAAPLLSGVQNRNHCPYCLWSRHLDLVKAGDRLAACKAVMQPVALTLKQTRNKYPTLYTGELMLVHCCSECDKLSINRIAADDDADMLFTLLGGPVALNPAARSQLAQHGIRVLMPIDQPAVKTRLFGRPAAAWAG